MADKKRLIEILRKPIFPHELVDPTEAVADYLLDNDVVPVVRCKDCKYCRTASWGEKFCARKQQDGVYAELSNLRDDDFCSYGERREGA